LLLTESLMTECIIVRRIEGTSTLWNE